MRSTWLLAGGGAGAALAGYALAEPYRFRTATQEIPIRGPVPALTLLHVSDWHLKRGHRLKQRWLRALPERLGEVPDLVVATGDMIEEDDAVDPVVELMAGLEARLGRFYVPGSHDYFRAEFQSYAKYWTGRRPSATPRATTGRLEEGLADKGWVALTNRSHTITTEGGAVHLAGVDDPYLKRARTEHLRRPPDAKLAIGVMHTPDLVSQFVLRGFDLVLAGHTHAGQVRIPGVGAVVTNCSLPSRLAGGLHPIGGAWLHVSPGLGTGKFSPIRFCARPEVTLLRLRPS